MNSICVIGFDTICVNYKKEINVDTFAKNLRKIMDSKNFTGEKLGEIIGVGKSTVINWANGSRFPKENHIRDIAKALNVNYDDLFTSGNEINIRVIPLIGKSSCGVPRDYDLNGYEPIPIPVNMYRDGMYAVEAEGDSMSPKINNGDIVYCHPNRIVDIGNIVHYWLNGESGIKRYKMNEAGTIISLVPINSNYDIISIHCDENVDLRMAKVVGKIDKDF